MSWRLDQVDRCVEGLADEALGQHVLNEGRAVDAVLDEILQRLDVRPVA